jgi:diketogulonate reductase-like aldo/keto reductase
VPRSELFITTKYDRLDDYDVFTEFHLELAKLGTGYVDLLLIHAPPKGQPANEVWRAFEALVEQGYVRSIGVSNYNQAQIQEITDLPARIKPAVNQIHVEPYSQFVPCALCATGHFASPCCHADFASPLHA